MSAAPPSARLLRLLALGMLLLASSAPVSAAPPGAPAELQGIARGAVVPMDPYFQWLPTEARYGILGTMEGTTKEFESIPVEVGADRTVFTAAQRLGYEAYRIRSTVERGELHTVEVKGDLAAVRLKLKDVVYLCSAKQLGRTAVFFRSSCPKKDEAGLARLLSGMAQRAKTTADDVDGWIPVEVKTAWTKKQEGDVLVVEDGTIGDPARAEVLQTVRDAHALVKQGIGGGWTTTFPPVIRITASRDLFSHLAGRRDLGDVDAVHVPWAGELLVSPRKKDALDAPSIAAAASRQALHHVLGAAGGEPLETGFARRAQALAEGAAPGALLSRNEAQAVERVKAKQAQTWMRFLKSPGIARAFANPDTDRAIDAELSAIWVSLGGPLAKASLTAWVGAMRKHGDPEAAAEAGYSAVDSTKADAEFWAFWTPRADPPKKPKPGEKPTQPAKPGK